MNELINKWNNLCNNKKKCCFATHIPLLSCLQWRRSATSGLQPLSKHQPEHQHQIRAQFATTGAHHPVRFPPSAAAAGVRPTGGARTVPCRQPQLLLQLVWRLRPRGPPARFQHAPGTGQTPRGQRRQGKPLCQTLAHGLVGDIERPSQASSHQPVREREGLDVERNEGTRVLSANIIMPLFNPHYGKCYMTILEHIQIWFSIWYRKIWKI